ncbi:MAG TPA: glycosyltransferase family 39 protein [Burkholderiales bacterium]|nr:glycosyltransferase family 39 protein [Burkholderiales bacterium]
MNRAGAPFPALSSRQRTALIAILALAGILRALAAWHYWAWFDGEFPGLWKIAAITLSQDASTYIQQAGPPGHFSDRVWSENPFNRPPLASWYFAALHPLLAFDRFDVALVQTALAVVAYLAIFSVARRVVGINLALVATALAALHPVLIFFDRSFEDTVPAFFLVALSIASLQRLSQRRRMSDAVLCGWLLALAGLARSNLLLLVPLAMIWLFWISPRSEPIARADFDDALSDGWTRIGIGVCALVVLAALALNGIRQHKLPFDGLSISGVPHYEQMIVALVCAAFAGYFSVVAYRTREWLDTLIAAAIGGIAILLQPLTALLIGAVIGLRHVRARAASAPEAAAPVATRAWLLVAFTVPVAVGLALASAHNWKTGKVMSPLVSSGGQNLYWGNTPFAYHRITIEGPSGIPWLLPHEPGTALIVGLLARFPSKTTDEAMGKAAMAAIKEDPIAEFWRLADKARRDFATHEIARNESFVDERLASPMLRLPLIPFALIFGLAVGYLALSGRWREATILFLPWIAVLLSETVFFNAARYRSLAVPFLLPLAVAGAVVLWRALSQREERARAVVMVVFVIALFVLGETAVSQQEKDSERATELFKMARLELYYVDHRLIADLRPAHPASMEKRLEDALRLDPDHLSAHYLWSMWQIAQGSSGAADARNAIRQARCAEQDWLCREVCARIADIAAAPDQYRSEIERVVAEKKRALDDFAHRLDSREPTRQ